MGFRLAAPAKPQQLLCLDRVTQWIDCVPCVTKDTGDTIDALQQLIGLPSAKRVYSDNSNEIRKAVAKFWPTAFMCYAISTRS